MTLTRQVWIAQKYMVAQDICALELEDPAGDSLPTFTAGAHIDVHLPGGLVRPYSLCSSPDDRRRYRIAVLREPASRGGSTAVHQLAQGQTVGIGQPRNLFPLAVDAEHHLLVAGGIGITPILCMAKSLAATGRPFTLRYCARSRERAAFADEILSSSFAACAHLHLDDGPAEQRSDFDSWLAACSPRTHLYVCGPTGLIDAVLNAGARAGWSASRLHREYFAASASVPNGNVPFEVQVHSTGAIIPVAADQSVVTALAVHGIEIPVSCEQGICGTCITTVLDGRPDHKDVFLTPAEQAAGTRFTPCCSRALSRRLVLDL